MGSQSWSGMEQGIDGYPIIDTNGEYLISGGESSEFKAQ